MTSCASPRGTGQRRRIEVDENTAAVVFTRTDAHELDVVDDVDCTQGETRIDELSIEL